MINITNFKIVSIMFWIHFISPILSVIINAYIFIINIDKFNMIQTRKKEIPSLSLRLLMSKFKWEENYGDCSWTPSIYSILCNGHSSNCIGAAQLAKFWYTENGIPSRIIYLFNDDLTMNQSICIRNDNTKFVFNKDIIDIKDKVFWMDQIYYHFNEKYSLFFETQIK